MKVVLVYGVKCYDNTVPWRMLKCRVQYNHSIIVTRYL
jgi:hypothetical protein